EAEVTHDTLPGQWEGDTLASVAAVESADVPQEESGQSLGWLFLLAFGGGLLGLLTPCVFPMIPMTVSYFMKHGGRKQAVFYGLSIVVIYLLVGILLSALFGQGAANAISTHWLPNVLFTLIFIAFAFSLLGYYEINLPASWINGSDKKAESAGLLGTFFMALTLVLVSFSCTLPIAGAVALGAAGGSFLAPLVGMLGFSLAFALPFTLFAFFPGWLSGLPKSGGWMNTLKVSLAFVELAFAFKFLSVPDQVYHWHILDREVFLSIWIVLFGMLGAYLLGKLRFPLDGEMPVQRNAFRFTTAVAVWCFVVYLIPGLWGAPLQAVSGWLPPMSTQDFVLSSYAAPLSETETSSHRYADRLKAPAGWSACFEYDEVLSEARAAGRPALLVFTGHGCVNCRLMEQAVLADTRVREKVRAQLTPAFLYVDDKVLELPEEAAAAPGTEQRFKWLGEKNAWLEGSLFHQNAQPCHVLVDPSDGRVLAGPLFYETDVEKYLAFLESGIRNFQKKP
ncbi:MAG: hypothetical protein J6Z12_06085, partial [Paludibacteraceae bacterium]|nr:hypothetical protein [Paludibacteraceae bacterium]